MYFYLHYFTRKTKMDVVGNEDTAEKNLKPIPRERAFLETFCYTIAQFQFDRAQEFVEKEREMFKPEAGSNWNALLNALLTFAHAEKNYFTMAFIEKKLFKQTIRPLYTNLSAELTKQEVMFDSPKLHSKSTPHGVEALTVELSKQIIQFTYARLKMIDFYEFMAKSGWNHALNIQEIIQSITDISMEFSKAFHHPILDPLKTSFSYEVDIVSNIFKTENHLAEWDFLDSLLLLRECQAKLSAWSSLSPSTSVKEQLLSTFSYKSLFSRSNRKQTEMTPFLYQWLISMYSSLLSKFSFYFFTSLSAQAPAADIKASLSKTSIDFISKFLNFQRKTDVLSMSLVLDTTTKKNTFKGHGYHLQSTICEKPTGMNSYPSVMNIPDIRPKEHWPNVISIINDQRQALNVTDKIVYFYDQKLESSYFLIKVDVRMTLVLIYSVKRKERDNYIQNFLVDIRASLNHDKLYHMLRPGQAKAF